MSGGTLTGNVDLSGNDLLSPILKDVRLSEYALNPTSTLNILNSATIARLQTSGTATIEYIQYLGGTPSEGQMLVLVNESGNTQTLVNEDAVTGQEIVTGTGLNLNLSNEASALLVYTNSQWHVIGGSGSGGSGLAVIYANSDIASPLNNTIYSFNTATIPHQLTLPAITPTEDFVIWVSDRHHTAGTHNITIDAATNSQTIAGFAASEDYVIDIDGGWVKLSRDAGSNTWTLNAPAVLGEDPSATLLAANNTWTGTNDFGTTTFSSDPTFTSGSDLVTPGSQTFTGTKTFADISVGTGLLVTNDGASSITIEGEVAVNTTDLVVDSAGNVGIGTASPGTVLDVNGNAYVDGISFDAGSNVLSNYETGTWTPSTGVLFNITGTAVYTTAQYIRIGPLVSATIFSVTGLTITTTSSRAYIQIQTTGLPGVTNTTQFYGTAFGFTSRMIPITVTDAAPANGQVLFEFDNSAFSGSLTFQSLQFHYYI